MNRVYTLTLTVLWIACAVVAAREPTMRAVNGAERADLQAVDLTGAAGRVVQDEPGVVPQQMSRALRTFDFEERSLGNVEDTPMGWVQVLGPGLPEYLKGVFDTTSGRSGRTSFRFDLNGGSVIYRHPAERIRVLEDALYRVEVFARTTPLDNARAVLTAYFADADGLAMESTIRQSQPLSSAADDASWHRLSVEIAADDPRATSLVIELGLLQPGTRETGSSELRIQDIHGSAWFDDVRVAQIPRVAITTVNPGNLFFKNEPIQLAVRVHDRITTDLAATLQVRDARGQSVYQRSGALQLTPGDARNELVGTIEVPDLPPGWYEVGLTMTSQGQFVDEEVVHFVKFGDDPKRNFPDPRFGVIATDLPQPGWAMLPDVLQHVGAGRVKLSVWSRDGGVETTQTLAFDQLLERFSQRGVSLTACLSSLPPEVRRNIAGDDWPRLLTASIERWQPQLAYLVSRHANHLHQWQLLPDDQADRFVNQPEMRQVYDRVFQEFSQLIGAPDLAMPWPAWFDMDRPAPSSVTLVVPSVVLPEQLPLYIADMKQDPHRTVSLSLSLIDREKYGRQQQIRDYAQRFVYALAAGADRVDVPLPMRLIRSGEGFRADPDELLVILRTITTQLSGATFVGKLPLAEGVEAFLFEREGAGLIVAWTRDAGVEAGEVELPLTVGAGAVRTDLWGSSLPLSLAAESRFRESILKVGPMPVFFSGVDAALMKLRASMKLDNPMVESSFEPHQRVLSLTNTFATPISGSVRLAGPAGWTIGLLNGQFSLNPGETASLPVTIEFPYNSFAGEKTIAADVQIEAREAYRMNVPISLKLGLSDVGLQSFALRSGNEIAVQQMITNYGKSPIDYTAFVMVPGQARQERLITKLLPGRTTLKKYRVPAGTKKKLDTIRSGLREMDGTRVLNEEVGVY